MRPFRPPSVGPLRGVLLSATLVLLTTLFFGSAAARAAEVDSRMLKEPLLELPPVEYQVDPRFRPLWLQALAQPENDLKRQAADAFTRASGMRMSDDGETSKALARQFDDEDIHPLGELSVSLLPVPVRPRPLLRGWTPMVMG